MLRASDFDRRVSFLRRAAIPPAGTLRGGFEPYGSPEWAWLRNERERAIDNGEMTFPGRTATLTLRDSAWARTLTTADRVLLYGHEFAIMRVGDLRQSDGSLELDIASLPDRGAYIAALEQEGETVVLRRIGPPLIEATVRARVLGYRPEELVAGLQQGDRKVIALAADVAASWAEIPRSGDKIVIRGIETNVQGVDDNTRRIANELIAYEFAVRG